MKTRENPKLPVASLKPLRGFPGEAFTRMEDIKDYLDGDKVVCLLCGRAYVALGGHIGSIHGISSKDYRIRFGIPSKYGLAAKHFRARSSRRIKRMRKEGQIPYSPSPAAIKKLLAHKRRPPVEALRHENEKKLLRIHGKKSFWQAADYEEFLRRIKSGRTAYEVGRDKGMPTKTAFLRHLQNNPVLKKKYQEVWETLPFSVQVRAKKTGERYRRTLVRLRREGKTWERVAKDMKLKMTTVRNMWWRLKQDGTLKKYM